MVFCLSCYYWMLIKSLECLGFDLSYVDGIVGIWIFWCWLEWYFCIFIFGIFYWFFKFVFSVEVWGIYFWGIGLVILMLRGLLVKRKIWEWGCKKVLFCVICFYLCVCLCFLEDNFCCGLWWWKGGLWRRCGGGCFDFCWFV